MSTNLLIKIGIDLLKEAIITHDFTNYHKWLHDMSILTRVHELDINTMIIEEISQIEEYKDICK